MFNRLPTIRGRFFSRSAAASPRSPLAECLLKSDTGNKMPLKTINAAVDDDG